MSAPLVHTNIALEVRDLVDQIVYTRAAGPADIERFASSKITDLSLNKIIGSACRYVVLRTRNTHLPELIQRTTANLPLPANFLRLVDDSVTVGGVKAKRLSFREKRMIGPARSASSKYPVYSFEACQFESEDCAAVDAAFDVVVWPDRVEYPFVVAGGVQDGFDIAVPAGVTPDMLGMSIRITDGGLDGANVFDHYTTIVNVGGVLTMKEAVEAAAPNGLAGVVYDEQTYLLRERLGPAVVARSAELVFTLMSRLDLASTAASMVTESVGLYGIGLK